MYHHSQQQGSQPFANGPRPLPHRPSPNEHQSHPSSGISSTGYQFPRPTQLPDELESALAIHGARDMDHRLIDLINQSNHENQSSGSRVSQHGNYGSNPRLTPEEPQGIEWSAYQPPTKLFASPQPSGTLQSQRPPGPHQQPQSSHTASNIPRWTGDSPSPQARHPRGSGGEGQGLYTPESAGSILASFGLSNEDLEVLSHYPDDQLTPDTLPFILRDIQISKSGTKKAVGINSAPPFSRNDRPQPSSRSPPMTRPLSPNVPSLLTVTQTAGKVIDYGHASRTTDETPVTDTFKRELLPSERTVKMYASSSSSSSVPKKDMIERRQVRMEHTDSSKYGDQDYRRAGNDHRKSNRSPGRDFPLQTKSRYEDIDYRLSGPKFRNSSETTSEASSRRPPSSSYKKIPTPTMISDFSAMPPKVYPHTCSLCHIQCDQEKDWVDHVNTVNHTAACRDLRNKYIDWKPDLPSRSGRYGSRAPWDPKDRPRSHSGSRSLSHSPTSSPPRGRRMGGPHPHRVQGKPYSPHPHPGHHPYTGSSHRGAKRPREGSPKFPSASSRHVMSSKHGPPHSSTKAVKPPKPATKTAKTANTKAADTSARPTILKKKKKVVSQASQDSKVTERLVYLTGIPKDATEQEVTDLVGSFGKINNVILMPCSEEETKSGEGQKASVCMVKAEDAQSLAASTNLSIRDQKINAVISQKPSAENPSSAKKSVQSPALEKPAAVENTSKETTTIKTETKVKAEQKTSNEKALVLITGLPESGWSESDIVSLVEPFGTPSEVITAKQIGKALLLMPDMDVAQEMVKLNTFTPMELKDCELSMTQLSQSVSLNTPVALYNLLMGSAEPSESSAPLGWSSLLVINNIPGTPSGPAEVEKLVRRFGTVIKTLVVNSMLICQMATAAMALSVYKRFQTFPCIIHNNPLYFSRKPDPKTSTQSKVVTAKPAPHEETPAAKDKAIQPSAPPADKKGSEHPSEEMKKADEGKDEPVKSAEESVGAVEALAENGSKDDDIKKDEPVTDPSAAPDAQPEAELETKTTETSTLETGAVTEAVEEEQSTDEPKAENDKVSAEEEEAKPCISDSKEVSPEEQQEELPKLTQEMVNTLLVECRTRTNSGAASTNGDKEETQTEADHGKKAAEKTKVAAKNHAEQEAKKQERDRKEREARKEKEARERERKERERKAWEKERAKREKEREERARRERERREQERKEWERKDRARRERKRSHGDDVPGSRWSGRSEAKSSRRDESHSETENEMGEMSCDEFPFNLSDFVTVDEVGEVADLPCDPCSPETMEQANTSTQVDASEDTPVEVSTEATVSETPSTLVQSEPTPESEAETVPAAEKPNGLMASDVTLASQTSPSDSSQSQTHMPVCEPEVQEPSETESAVATTQAEPIATPALADLSAPAEEKQQEEEQNEQEENQLPQEEQKEEEEKREEENQLEEEEKREKEKQLEEEKKREKEKQLEEEKERQKERQLKEEQQKEEEKRLKEEKQKVEEKCLEEEKRLKELRQKEEERRLEEEKQKEEKRLKELRQKEEERCLEEEKQKEEKQLQEQKQQEAKKAEETNAPAEDTENLQKCEDQTQKKEEESVQEKNSENTGNSLPPYNPSNPVGMEFLVPKTGFFCKPCNRFFTGVKEAEISHCKTLKHYDNLQKYLQSTKRVSS